MLLELPIIVPSLESSPSIFLKISLKRANPSFRSTKVFFASMTQSCSIYVYYKILGKNFLEKKSSRARKGQSVEALKASQTVGCLKINFTHNSLPEISSFEDLPIFFCN